MDLTFNDLPKAISQLQEDISFIKKFILEKSKESIPETDRWFDLRELCDYLPDKPARATVYTWVHLQTIPFHKGSKKLRFLRSEIDKWLKSTKHKTMAEIVSENDEYLARKKRVR
jgi:predicted DNA-binding transcriptional regulator AlpA